MSLEVVGILLWRWWNGYGSTLGTPIIIRLILNIDIGICGPSLNFDPNPKIKWNSSFCIASLRIRFSTSWNPVGLREIPVFAILPTVGWYKISIAKSSCASPPSHSPDTPKPAGFSARVDHPPRRQSPAESGIRRQCGAQVTSVDVHLSDYRLL